MKTSHKVLLAIGLSLALSVGAPFLLVIFVVQPVKLEGQSMRPALSDGDKALFLKSFGTLKRGDIVVFKYPYDTTKSYFKRIVGLPGETVAIRAGRVYINDNELSEGYVAQEFNQVALSVPLVQIPQKHYYMIGDNRDHSSDSRTWGTVAEELIYGKYFVTYY